jgi:signal transduction histidine kinase
VAHELRTPLTNMRGYLEALDDGVLPPSSETIRLLQDETLRLAQLVEDVLQLARADAAHGRLETAPLDLGQLIHETLETLSPEFARKSITVHRNAPPTPVVVAADRRRLTRVLRNLADNAARYSPEGGRVDITIEAAGRQVQIEFRNTAPELVSRELPFIFERFYRGEKSRSRKHGGAGIGLAIVKELVEAHGGEVGAHRDGDKVCIRMTLPQPAP